MERTGTMISRIGLRIVLFWCAGSGFLHAAKPGGDFVTRDVTDQYRIRFWNAENGLPANRVQSIAQTPDGYLWLGTYFGLVRFDGNRFEVFNQANTPELAGDDIDIPALEVDAVGNLWIGTKNGLLRYFNGKFTRFTEKDGLLGREVWNLKALPNGDLWLCTGTGLTRFANGRFTHFKVDEWKDRYRVAHLSADDGAVTLQAGNSSTFRFDSDTGKFAPFVPDPRTYTASPAEWMGMLPTKDYLGRVWASVQDRIMVYQSAENRWSTVMTFDTERGFSAGWEWNPFFQDHDRRTWFRLRLGAIGKWEGDHVEEIALKRIHTTTSVVAMYQARDGTYWVGTEEGLFQIKRRGLDYFQSNSKRHPDRFVNSVTTLPDDTVLAGLNAHVMQIKGDQVIPIDFSGPAEFSVKCITARSPDEIFMGMFSVGTKRLVDTNGWVSGIPGVPHGADGIMNVVYLDSRDRLWIGTSRGAKVYDPADQSYKNYNELRGLPEFSVNCVFEDSEHRIWLGTAGEGVKICDDSGCRTFLPKDGFTDTRAWTIHESPSGTFWIGTANGLSRYKDGKFFNFTTANGYPESTINMILEDDDGMFWFSGLKGIYRIDPKELNAVADGRARSFSILALGEADGMLSSETNGEKQPAGCKTSDGRLWFPTINGVVAIDPARFRDSVASNAPPPVIETVLVDNQIEFDNGVDQRGAVLGGLDQEFVLAPGRARSVEIRYTANNFDAPHKVRFWVRMSGMDGHWQDMENRRTRFYTNLKPGRYHFEVKTANNHGRVSPQIAGFSFVVLPYYYETGWFWCLIVAGVLGLGYAAHRWRLSIVGRFQRLEKLEALNLERERIARDIHDDIGNQLTQIKLLTEMSRQQTTSDAPPDPHLDKMAKVARAALQALGEIVWTTNPKNDTLRGLAAFLCQVGEEVLQLAGIAVRVKNPAGLPEIMVKPRIRHELLLVFKEVLNNIVVHAGASEVHLEMKLEDREFIVIVRDNGRGFDSTGNGQSRAGGGNGLGNMRTRMAGIAGGLAIHSEAEKGTTIVLTVKL